jgi:hypothetical protein
MYFLRAMEARRSQFSGEGAVEMENNFEQYETLLGSASEVAEACLDMEDSAFLLAWAGELIQDLVAKGYRRSACLTVQKLREVVGTDCDCAWAERDELETVEKQAWLIMFAETLMNHVMTVSNISGS